MFKWNHVNESSWKFDFIKDFTHILEGHKVADIMAKHGAVDQLFWLVGI